MNCKKCKKELGQKLPLHFSNRMARELEYCSFICLSAHLGKEKALEMLQNKGNTGKQV